MAGHSLLALCAVLLGIVLQLEAAATAPRRRLHPTLSEDVGAFWHFTDVHYQWDYKVASDPQKKCESGVGTAGIFGDMKCDSPEILVASAFELAVQTLSDPDFVLWTGDFIPHDLPGVGQGTVSESIGNVTKYLQKYFPKSTIYPLLGNHDSYPQHQNKPSDWVFQSAVDWWKDWLPKDCQETYRKGGYYSLQMFPGVKLIALNTVFYYHLNKAGLNYTDPADEFAWLHAELEDSKQKAEKVFVIGHVPPGYSERGGNPTCHEDFNNMFLEYFYGYNDIIIGHWYGHLHSDSFRFFYDSKESHDAASVMFLTGAVDEWGGMNPQMRLFYYNRTDFTILNYDQWFVDLEEANKKGSLEWQFEYNAASQYGLKDLSLDSMKQFYNIISTDEDAFYEYWYFNTAGYHPKPVCDPMCRAIQLCAIKEMNTKRYEDCLNSI